MRGNTFGRSLLFALGAALAFPFLAMLGSSMAFDTYTVFALYAHAAVLLYLVWLSPSAARAVAVSVPTAILSIVVLVLSPTPGVALLGAAMLLGVMRTAFIEKRKAARALVIEASALIGGLVLARWVLSPSLLDQASALWCFFLCQSVVPLIGGAELREDESAAPVDPFEAAQASAMAILEP